MKEAKLNGFDKLMEIRKKGRDGLEEASPGPVEFHQVNCPGCVASGKFKAGFHK